MGMKIISQPGSSAMVGRREVGTGSSQELGWGSMGVFGVSVAAGVGVCALLQKLCEGRGGSGAEERIWGELFVSLGF